MNDSVELLNSARFLFRSFVHLLLAAVLTLPVSVLLLGRYRAAIGRWMRMTPSGPPPLPSGPPPLPREEPPLAVRTVDLSAPSALSEAAKALAGEARAGTRALGAVYTAAGLLHATATVAIIAAVGHYSFTLQTLVGFWVILAWPTAFIVGQIAIPSRRVRWLLPVVLLAVVAALSGRQFSLLVDLAALYVLPPLALIAAVTNRRFRTAGLFVFPGIFVVLTSTRHAWIEGGRFDTVAAAGAAFLSALAVLGLLRWFAWRYERRRMSDVDLTLDLQWFLLTVWQGFCLTVHLGRLSALSLAPFVFYKLCVLIGRRFSRSPPAGNRQLLLLRTFGARHRSERLLDEMGVTWRWLGSIVLIGAPDVAGATIDPPKFLAFVTGRARGLFVQDNASLARRLEQLDRERDASGRYRINECYCLDRIWRLAVLRLARDCAVVLMDLRAFSAQRAGCADELQLLLDNVPLSRVVLLVDTTTRLDELALVLEMADRRRATDSPNGAASRVVDLVRISSGGPGAARRLVERLCAAASQTGARP